MTQQIWFVVFAWTRRLTQNARRVLSHIASNATGVAVTTDVHSVEPQSGSLGTSLIRGLSREWHNGKVLEHTLLFCSFFILLMQSRSEHKHSPVEGVHRVYMVGLRPRVASKNRPVPLLPPLNTMFSLLVFNSLRGPCGALRCVFVSQNPGGGVK